ERLAEGEVEVERDRRGFGVRRRECLDEFGGAETVVPFRRGRVARVTRPGLIIFIEQSGRDRGPLSVKVDFDGLFHWTISFSLSFIAPHAMAITESELTGMKIAVTSGESLPVTANVRPTAL